MEIKMPAKGFVFPLGNKDVFVITELKNKTESLARKILRKMSLPENPDTVREILYWLQRAEIDVKAIEGKGAMFDIHGDGFGGRGSWVHDGKTIVIAL